MPRKFTATALNGKDMTAELTAFATSIGLERAAPGRYSILLVLGLFGELKSGHLNPAKVVREIEFLEGIGRPIQLKPPSPFNYPPLKGLSHKHYLEDGFAGMAINLRKGIRKYGLPLFKQRMHEAKEVGEERYVTVDDCNSLANDAVQGNWIRLASAEELTGEWIVYVEHDGVNYYLCLGMHDKNRHDDLRKQIDTVCCHEFPFLTALLTPISAPAP